MRILYIDESGDTASFEQGGTKILVLTGCIIDEKDKRDIELKFREIKKRYYQNPDIEIKSNFLRYANPKINDPEKTIPIKIISVIIDKKGYWAKYPSQNPYHAAYTILVERFQTYLENNDASGICIIDPREGRVVDKKFIDKDLDKVHGRLQWSDDGYWKQCSRVIEKT